MSKALEYSATVECTPKLLHTMQRERTLGNEAKLLLIVDRFGVLHPPGGLGRTALMEQSFAKVRVAFHYHTGEQPRWFYQLDDDFKGAQKAYALFEATVSDL